MTLTSLVYLGFFAAVAVLHYVLPRVLRPYFLLVANYAFYCYAPQYRPLALVLAGATLITWLCGLVIGSTRVKAVRVLFLLLTLLGGAGVLLYYKYWGLVADLVGGTALPRHDLLAPLGLSYFLFAAMSYTIDVFKRRCKVEYNPLHYAMFVSFFPTMITGPIERYPHLRPQLKQPRRFSYQRCAGGLFRILWGYMKKMVIADNLARYVGLVYGTPDTMAGPQLAAASLLFIVQLYMDFSGCCDIALGVGRILGYDLIENFRAPFEATSFSELWNRWHISMTSWFRDYIYFPMGGSRCNLVRRSLNVIIVFTVSGLWHGAEWQYLLWGLICGVISAVGRATLPARKVLWRHNPLYRAAWLQTLIQRCVTVLLFAFAMSCFACALYGADPFGVYAGMLQGWQGLAPAWQSVTALIHDSGIDGRMPVVLTCAVVIVLLAESHGRNVARWIRQQNFVLRWTLYYAAGTAILFFGAFGQSAFIYQQF